MVFTCLFTILAARVPDVASGRESGVSRARQWKLLVAEWRSTTATRSEPEGRRARLAAPERPPLEAIRPAPPAGARGRRLCRNQIRVR